MRRSIIRILWLVPLSVALMSFVAARECGVDKHRPLGATLNALAGVLNIGIAVWVFIRARRAT